MLAVHGGVGFKMPEEAAKWCSNALKTTDDDIVVAVKYLEDHKFFNCGVGANLTAQGTVECEAGYMTSKYFKFGAVGCVSSVKNPIVVARGVALDAGIPGLMRPQVLVGKGAEQWAREKGFEMCEPEDLISSAAQEEWRVSTQKFVQWAKESNQIDSNECEDDFGGTFRDRMDTVGGIAIKDGHTEACVSSGGILLKRPGRLGHSTHLGCGAWADKCGDILIAVSASGCGEALVRTDFCRSLARAVMNRSSDELPAQVIDRWFQKEFLRSPYLSDIPVHMILAGGIVMLQEPGCAELLAFHNTPAFPLAFKSRGKVRRIVSKLPHQAPVKVDSYLL